VWAIQRALNKNQAQEGRCVAAGRAGHLGEADTVCGCQPCLASSAAFGAQRGEAWWPAGQARAVEQGAGVRPGRRRALRLWRGQRAPRGQRQAWGWACVTGDSQINAS